ncbi:MAG: methyl-coenzyme M reductase operon protein D [Candidatus Methanoliparum thermophilum]|uniref:Methyl-coenzyme M reductase operon protein D n=1 Tax=Methanoliparum thermophilum TaxID=2491083 RepID=A0A520KTP8_METT2|nr:methyl-coenzyme M reductase operon protein D [Candidatus Methanoliparum sp. LAM-1]RZN65464.1 MAG: methyl-coenzyme M reductase operon protein D [Candidatus Methanoliparum thermophilum]BDC35445.1 methyl-coenzyme M reductase operon protein D [Candidatus Methanoliparum sp. LAM-1]
MSITDLPSIQIEIIPQRLLGASSAEKVLNTLAELKGVKRIAIQGPRLPGEVSYQGVSTDRREIQVGGIVFEIKIALGRIMLELESETILKDVENIVNTVIPCKASIRKGKFFRDKMTVSDYAKYGIIKDERIIGLVDPKSNDIYELGTK